MVDLIIVMILTCGGADPADNAPRYDDWFLDKGLRIDLYHVGDHDTERVCIDELKEEKYFSGPKKRLIDERDLGHYRCEVRDAASGDLIFSSPYCGLFNEWRTIAEARSGVWRAVEHSVIIPWPKAPIHLTVSQRGEGGEWKDLLKQEIPMEARFIVKDNPFGDLKVKPVMINGEPSKKLDLLVIGDGYGPKEKTKFDKDVKRAHKSLFSSPSYKDHKNKFNVWSVWCPSPESGVDEPRNETFRSTALGVTFNFFDLPRYSMTAKIHTLFDAASSAPHDVILLLFNSERFGGGGIFNLYAACSAGKAFAGLQVLVHELGHATAGLADEYYGSGVTYIDYYPEGTEPWEPNITALLDPRNIKWKHLIEKGTPLPTPKSSKYRSAVGCFEGAGYKAKGLFRPCLDCVMFSLMTSEYCPVCTEAIERAIDFYSK